MMEQPAQNPPVERMYMRLVVGRRGKPDQPAEEERRQQSHPVASTLGVGV